MSGPISHLAQPQAYVYRVRKVWQVTGCAKAVLLQAPASLGDDRLKDTAVARAAERQKASCLQVNSATASDQSRAERQPGFTEDESAQDCTARSVS